MIMLIFLQFPDFKNHETIRSKRPTYANEDQSNLMIETVEFNKKEMERKRKKRKILLEV